MKNTDDLAILAQRFAVNHFNENRLKPPDVRYRPLQVQEASFYPPFAQNIRAFIVRLVRSDGHISFDLATVIWHEETEQFSIIEEPQDLQLQMARMDLQKQQKE